MRVVVIGTGLAGLAATALLSKAGHDVTALEQHEQIGGVTASLERDGYRWDWGQMLVPDFGPAEPARQILEELGVFDEVHAVAGYRENYFPDFRIQHPPECLGVYWRKDYFKKLFPEDFRQRTHLQQHAFGGCVPHVKIPPPPHETPVPGLWFVGAQSEVYGGVAGAMTGSNRVVERILDAMRKG